MVHDGVFISQPSHHTFGRATLIPQHANQRLPCLQRMLAQIMLKQTVHAIAVLTPCPTLLGEL